MQVRVLGPIEIAGSTGNRVAVPGAKLRGLVAILSLEAGSTVPSARLIEALWGDQPVQGQNTLQVLVSKLRRLLVEAGDSRADPHPADRLPARRGAGRRRCAPLRDAARRRGFRCPDDPVAVATTLGTALDLWTGAALADVPATDVFASLRTRLEELHRGAVEDLVDAELALGYHQRLAPELESLVAEEPLRERRWGQLMRALYGSGQQAGALRAFQRARDILIEELGIEPSVELRRLEAAVLAHDDAQLGAPAPVVRRAARSARPSAGEATSATRSGRASGGRRRWHGSSSWSPVAAW